MGKSKFTIGIDEVGRGALAGPVVVAAARIAGRPAQIANRKLGTLKDSKQLSARQREAWFAHFKNHPQIAYAVARVYPRGIERMNISKAANVAAERAYRRLFRNFIISKFQYSATENSEMVKYKNTRVFLDGGLFLGNREQPKNAKTIVKADEKIAAVAIASIIAKVTRDRFMKKLAKRHPAYGFEIHKGYGTKLHRAALAVSGPCGAHRLTFLHSKATI